MQRDNGDKYRKKGGSLVSSEITCKKDIAKGLSIVKIRILNFNTNTILKFFPFLKVHQRRIVLLILIDDLSALPFA